VESGVASVLGLYVNAAQAEQALDQLTAASFSSDKMSVLMRSAPGARGAGGTLGLLNGFAALTISDACPLLAAGPLRSMLTGQQSELGRADVGLEAALIRAGVSRSEALGFATKIEQGWVLLSVQCDASGDAALASSLLSNTGAEVSTPVKKLDSALDAARVGSRR
jgi:hypothetical protein